jgi:hypothetical protein
MRNAAVVCFGVLAISGCVALSTTAVERASRELRCPQAQLDIVNRPDIDDHVFDVSGCGHAARYMCFHPYQSDNFCAREPDPAPADRVAPPPISTPP